METGTQKQISARKLSILLLLAAPDVNNRKAQPVLGTTRMQKLIFLVSKETHLALQNSVYFSFDFRYEAEKFGPADLDLYQDLDFLRTMRLITWEKDRSFEPTQVPSIDSIIGQDVGTPILLPEEIEEGELSFEYLMGVDSEELLIADAESEGERRYTITQKGVDLLGSIRINSKGRQKEHFDALEDACTMIRQKYGEWSLRRLLKHVYNNYPSLTTRSIIRNQVL